MWISKKKYNEIKKCLEEHNKSIGGIIDIFTKQNLAINENNVKISQMQKDIQTLQQSKRYG